MAITAADLTSISDQEAAKYGIPKSLFTPFILDTYQLDPTAYGTHPMEVVDANAKAFAHYMDTTARTGGGVESYKNYWLDVLSKFTGLPRTDAGLQNTVSAYLSPQTSPGTATDTSGGIWGSIKNFVTNVTVQRVIIVVVAAFLAYLGLRGLMGPTIAIVKKGVE